MHLSKGDSSKLTGVTKSSVRFDADIPVPIAEYLRELANTANLVAEFFEGDSQKVGLWFERDSLTKRASNSESSSPSSSLSSTGSLRSFFVLIWMTPAASIQRVISPLASSWTTVPDIGSGTESRAGTGGLNGGGGGITRCARPFGAAPPGVDAISGGSQLATTACNETQADVGTLRALSHHHEGARRISEAEREQVGAGLWRKGWDSNPRSP